MHTGRAACTIASTIRRGHAIAIDADRLGWMIQHEERGARIVETRAASESAAIFELQRSLNGMLNWFLDIRSVHIDHEGRHRAPEIAAAIAAMAVMLRTHLKPDGVLIAKSPSSFEPATYLSDDVEYRSKVCDVLDACRSEIAGDSLFMALHGSLADFRYAKGWSDVDTLLVLRAETVESAARLTSLRRKAFDLWPLFCAVTPLQHHGLLVVTETDLVSYPSNFLPPAVLDQSLRLFGTESITFRVRQGDDGAERGIRGRRKAIDEALATGVYPHHPHHGVGLGAGFSNADDAMLQLFAFLGYVMTVPAFFMTAIGRPCYKGQSFALARPYFSDAAWAIIDKATSIREEWPQREYPHYAGNAVPRWLQVKLGADYIEGFSRLIDEALARITELRGAA
jgi:hypothetical protein